MPLIILLQLILWEVDSVRWEVDLLAVDLVGVDFVRVDLVGLTCTNIYIANFCNTHLKIYFFHQSGTLCIDRGYIIYALCKPLCALLSTWKINKKN